MSFTGNTFTGKPGIPPFDRCQVIANLQTAISAAEGSRPRRPATDRTKATAMTAREVLDGHGAVFPVLLPGQAGRAAAELEAGMRIHVHFNLHKGGFSVMSLSTRTVIARAGNITLTDVRFYVQPRGVARIRDKKQRSVVAYAIGTIESVDSSPAPATAGLLKVSFNPYRAAAFTTADGTEVSQAGYVIFASAVKDGRPAGYAWILRTPARAQAAPPARPAGRSRAGGTRPATRHTGQAGRRTQQAQIGAHPMILNPGMITTAGPIRQFVRAMAELGHHRESAKSRAGGGSGDLEYPEVVKMARALARQYADDAPNIHRYLAACGLDSEAAEDAPASADHMPHFTREPRPRTGHRVRLRQGPEATREPGVDAAHLAPDASPRARPAAGQLRGAGRMVRCRLRPGAGRPADPGRPARPARAGHARA